MDKETSDKETSLSFVDADSSVKVDSDGDAIMSEDQDQEANTNKLTVVGLEPIDEGSRIEEETDEVQKDKEEAETPGNEETKDDNNIPIQSTQEPTETRKESIETNKELQTKQEVSKLSQPAEPIPRLVIEQLILTNFKSYAGKQVVGPFHPSFSAVVGPNGSGKSNVIDSLLFVFGFRASKMRQSKLSELIHNSENFKDLPSCQVDVYFKKVIDRTDVNGKSYTEEVPNSQLIVSRRALRNNSSTYYINNRTSTFSRVRELLKGEGIDLDHKRFLILQGEVESIAQMKPKAEKDGDDGLLEYLEDIIGTSKYKESIAEKMAAIDEMNDICVEKERRFDFVKKSKDEMEEPKDKALDYLRAEREYLQKRATYLQCSLRKDQSKLEDNKKMLEKMKGELSENHKQKDATSKESEALHSQSQKLIAKMNEIEQQMAVVRREHKKIEKDKVTMDEKMKHAQHTEKKAQKTLKAHDLSLKEAKATLNINTENIEEYKKQEEELHDQLQTEKAKLDEIKMSLADKTKDLSKQMEKLQQQLQPWKEKLSSKQGQIDVKTSELEILQKRLKEIDDEAASVKLSCEEKTELITSKKKQISVLHQEKAHVKGQIEMGEPEVSDASNKLHIMESQLASARQKAEDARSRVRNTESRNRVLNALMHLKESGRLPGFYGRLGDLGVIDDKYDVAVSTGGGSLNDMVVETVECAQQCISYIRKNGLGFGKFIVLDKLQHFNLAPIRTPENVPRLFDLIEPVDAKFAPAFYSSMYDTLVTDNLRRANQVAFGGRRRWRVVTLDGKLVDSSGTMSGGGGSVYRGAMKLRSKNPTGAQHEISSSELQALLSDVQHKESAFSEASKAFEQMESALQEYKDRLPQIDVDVSKLEIEIKSLTEELSEAKKRMQEIKQNEQVKQKTKKEMSDVTKVLAQFEREKQEIKSQSADLERQIGILQQKIMDVGGVKLKLQNAKVDSIEQKLEILNEKKNNDSIVVSKTRNKIQRLEKQIEKNEKEIKDCEEMIQSQQKEYAEKMAKFEQSETQIKEMDGKRTDISDQRDSLRDQLESIDTKTSDLRKQEIQLMGEVEKYQMAVEGCEKRISNINARDGSFAFRDINELLGWMNEEEKKQYSQDKDALPQHTPEELAEMDVGLLKEEADSMGEKLQNTEVDLDVLKEYTKRYIEYNDRKTDLNASVTKRDEAKKMYEDLKKKRLDEFMVGFNEISSTLREMYHMITMGGNAELELVDSLDPFSEGILFSVMPPRKSWKNIGNLSGGEKTLSSLALVFALHNYKPTPLYVMDEIDAALDFRNVSIVANYIKGRTKNAQFIVISLRNNMFELAERLVGIYKVNNMTRSVTMNNESILNLVKDKPKPKPKQLNKEVTGESKGEIAV